MSSPNSRQINETSSNEGSGNKPDGYFFDIDRLLSDDNLSLQKLFNEQYYFCERCQTSIRIEDGRMYDQDCGMEDNTKQVHECWKSIKKRSEKKMNESPTITPQYEVDPFYRKDGIDYKRNYFKYNSIYQTNMKCNCYNCRVLRRFRIFGK